MLRSLIHALFEGITTMLQHKNLAIKILGLILMISFWGGLVVGFKYLMHLS